MVTECITKTYRQHATMVTSVPIEVRAQLDLAMGEYLVWQIDSNSPFVQVFKVIPGGNENVGDSRNTDRQDKGGRA